MNVYKKSIFIVLIFMGSFGTVKCQDFDGRLTWPVLPGFQPVAENQFKTYIEMRQTEDSDGNKFWTLYKCELDKDPIKIDSDKETNLLGDKRKFYYTKLSSEEEILVQVMIDSVTLYSLGNENHDAYELDKYNITDARYYFVHGRYLLATDRDVFDLEKLWNAKGDGEQALIRYEKIKNFKEQEITWNSVRDNCFTDNLFCASNVTATKSDYMVSFKLRLSGIFLINNFLLYTICPDDEGNMRCHFYLKDTSGQFSTQWYFPQNLTVSQTEADGIRTMLFPVIKPEDEFFQQSFQDFEPTKNPPTTEETKTTTTKEEEKTTPSGSETSKKSKKAHKKSGAKSTIFGSVQLTVTSVLFVVLIF